MSQRMSASLWVLGVLVLSGGAAARQPSQMPLKRSVCLERCAADIAGLCVPHHHFHQCRGTLIRKCQHRHAGVCVPTTTTTATSTTTTSTDPFCPQGTLCCCPDGAFIAGRLIVSFKEGTSAQRVAEIVADLGGSVLMGPLFSEEYVVAVPETQELAFVAKFEAYSEVSNAQPDYVVCIPELPICDCCPSGLVCPSTPVCASG
jgi:hypothetical protein